MKQKHFFTSLKSRSQIRALYKRGRDIKGDLHMVKYLASEDRLPPYFRIVWAVPRRTGSGVRRNRLKRCARAAFFEAVQKVNLQQGVVSHLVFLPREKFEKEKMSDRVDDICRTLERLQNELEKEQIRD